MKSFSKLQVLFFSMLFLIALILVAAWLNRQPEQKEPEVFYCGNAVNLTVSEFNNSTGESLYKENCKSCHKIHEESVGPALSGITERRPKKWIYAFVKNSAALLKKKDTMAVNLYNKYNKAEMIAFTFLTDAEIDSILVYIEQEPHAQPKYDVMPGTAIPSE